MANMRFLSTAALALGLSTLAGLVGASPVEGRDTCVYTCGSVCYWQTDIDAALAKGYSLYQSGETL
ncbi:hypothetical protein SCUCBS95973_008611, partial [Sporothrix curviconia]